MFNVQVFRGFHKLVSCLGFRTERTVGLGFREAGRGLYTYLGPFRNGAPCCLSGAPRRPEKHH